MPVKEVKATYGVSKDGNPLYGGVCIVGHVLDVFHLAESIVNKEPK